MIVNLSWFILIKMPKGEPSYGEIIVLYTLINSVTSIAVRISAIINTLPYSFIKMLAS